MLTKIYKHLHQTPEVSYQEENTISYICSILKENGILFTKYKNGLIAQLNVNEKFSFVGFRCELDALDIKETNIIDFKSKNDYMHACGHDMHMSVILGICLQANLIKEQLKTNVLFIFQRGEESGNGAANLVQEVKWPKISQLYAFHNSNVIDINKVGLQNGQINSYIIDFKINFYGKEAHVAQPYLGIDALNCAINFINLIKQNQSSNFGAHKQYLINFSNINTNNAINVICKHSVLNGTIRIASLDLVEKIWNYFEKTLQMCTKLNNCKFSLEKKELPALINNTLLDQKLRQLNLSFQNIVLQSSGGDDFANYQTIAPCYLIKLGSKWNEKEHDNNPVHSSNFLPNYHGIEYGVQVGLKILKTF